MLSIKHFNSFILITTYVFSEHHIFLCSINFQQGPYPNSHFEMFRFHFLLGSDNKYKLTPQLMTHISQIVPESLNLFENIKIVQERTELAREKEKILVYELEKESKVLEANNFKENLLKTQIKKLTHDLISNYLLKIQYSEELKQNLIISHQTNNQKKDCLQHLKTLKNAFQVLHSHYHSTLCTKCMKTPPPCPYCN